ncbi:MAG: hypothetical protein HC873_15340 [Leptolyngbyaceae cyanobacterium SL_1_1]|nr:hypothetical protein [Leptolyngbyaceae cyanobacterium SL_1_1]
MPELWVYNSGELKIYLFNSGHYTQSESSPNFPEIPVKELIPRAIALIYQVGSYQALEKFEQQINQSS